MLGTGLHGLFEHPDTCSALLGRLGLEHAEHVDYRAHRERELERLADTLEQQLDMDAVMALLDHS
ncbi:hypothetical protein [Vreelandella subglaciescola]|uniref:hypothetical protein n=1 Tax=Vreelandella subglaciescola TaxID=29571 RepID=UPI00267E70AE